MSAGEPQGSSTYPVFEESLPESWDEKRRYSVRFARSAAELDALQALRFEVFNLELREGLEESFATGRDRDRFDPVCHHLIVIEKSEDEIIGTYRMQTSTMAQLYEGFYTQDEFQLEALPRAVVDDAIEVGRAVVAKAFRSRQVLFLLWKGLAAYMQRNRKRYLFGCCSLTSQDPAEGKRVMEYLRERGHVHPDFDVQPQPGWECYPPDLEVDGDEKVDLPKLFSLYLRYGAKVCGPPAIDRHFKTIDYLVLLDVERLDDSARAMFFG